MSKIDITTMTPEQLISSDLDKSVVISELSIRVLNSEILTPEYEYIFANLVKDVQTVNGVKDYNYSELNEEKTGRPFEDVTIADFNGELNKVVRETAKAKQPLDVKTKMLDSVLHDFKVSTGNAFDVVFKSTENILKYVSKLKDILTIIEIDANALPVTLTGAKATATSGASWNKEIYTWLKKLNTTSKTHPIGTDPKAHAGQITVDGVTVQPALRFNSKDMIVFTSIDFEADTKFDGEKVFYNFGKNALEVSSVQSIDFAAYEPMADLVKASKLTGSLADLSKVKAIAIHKDALQGLRKFEGTKLANGPKLFTVIHQYLTYGLYRLKNKPLAVFTIA